MKKDLIIIGGLLLVVLGLLIFGGGFSSIGFVKQKSQLASSSSAVSNAVVIKIRNLVINSQVVSSETQRIKGLSGRDSLPINEGLLFVYDQKGKYTFWMKDMKFPIDMIWISDDKKIVYIAKGALPEPNKSDKDLTRYYPGVDAKYVLEINAGLSDANKLQIGDSAEFIL